MRTTSQRVSVAGAGAGCLWMETWDGSSHESEACFILVQLWTSDWGDEWAGSQIKRQEAADK